jgi:fluoroacetyl-CoA thioesterase
MCYQLIEGTCVRLISRYVSPGEQSVGFRIDVKHLAPTPVGKQVTSRVKLREVNGRRCVFDVEVHNEDASQRARREQRRSSLARTPASNG